jgi:hypothetical protein
MGEKCEASPFDRLPDELIIKIFEYLITEKGDMSSLLQTCRRFCRIINSNLLKHPDSVEYGWNWDENLPCDQCVRIFVVSNFKFPKCNTIFITLPLDRCCFNTLKTLKSKLNTITGLVLRGVIDLRPVSRLLAILEGVNRLRLCHFAELLVDNIPTGMRFYRTLFYLEIDVRYLKKRSALLYFPSRDIRVRNLNHYNIGSFKKYLFRYNRIINHVEVNIIGDRGNFSTSIAELSEAMKSLGFSVEIRPDYEGSIALEGFKSTSTRLKQSRDELCATSSVDEK